MKKYFERIIKQLLNSAFIGYEEIIRSQWITLSYICRYLLLYDFPDSHYLSG